MLYPLFRLMARVILKLFFRRLQTQHRLQHARTAPISIHVAAMTVMNLRQTIKADRQIHLWRRQDLPGLRRIDGDAVP